MSTMNSGLHITKCAPLLIKDEPHRLFDTFTPEGASLEIESEDYSGISIVKTEIESENAELLSDQCGTQHGGHTHK